MRVQESLQTCSLVQHASSNSKKSFQVLRSIPVPSVFVALIIFWCRPIPADGPTPPPIAKTALCPSCSLFQWACVGRENDIAAVFQWSPGRGGIIQSGVDTSSQIFSVVKVQTCSKGCFLKAISISVPLHTHRGFWKRQCTKVHEQGEGAGD